MKILNFLRRNTAALFAKKKIQMIKQTSPYGLITYHVTVDDDVKMASISCELEETMKYYEALIKSNGGNVNILEILSTWSPPDRKPTDSVK